MPVLSRLADDGSMRIVDVLELPGEDNLVGRGVGVHVSIVDETISRMHARVVRNGEQWIVVTLNAANPVRIGGQAVQQLELRPGTCFELGRVRLRFEREDPRKMTTLMLGPKAADAAFGDRSGSGQGVDAYPPEPTPRFNVVQAPSMPMRREPEAARGSWQAAEPDSVDAPMAALARVEAQGLEAMPPPLGSRDLIRVGSDAARSGVAAPATTQAPAMRRWPWVLLGVFISFGTAGILFHEKVGEIIERRRGGSELASRDATQGASTADEASVVAKKGSATRGSATAGEAGSDAASGEDLSPSQRALVTGANAEDEVCESAGTRRTKDIERALATYGAPSAVAYMVDPAGHSELTLDFGRHGKQVRFVDGQFAQGSEQLSPPGTTGAENLGLEYPVGLFDPSVPARCVVRALGPARLAGAGVDLETEASDVGVPLAWRLAQGERLVSEGSKVRSFHSRADAPGADQRIAVAFATGEDPWVGEVVVPGSGDKVHATLLWTTGFGGRHRVELLPPAASSALPFVHWNFVIDAPTEDTAQRVFEQSADDEVRVGGGPDGASIPSVSQLRLQLGSTEASPTGRVVRSVTFSFDLAGKSHVYRGTIMPTPWRVE